MTQETIDPLIAQSADGTCAKDLYLYLDSLPVSQLSEEVIIEQLDAKYKDRIAQFQFSEHPKGWSGIIIFLDASAFKIEITEADDDPKSDSITMSYGLYFSKHLNPNIVRH